MLDTLYTNLKQHLLTQVPELRMVAMFNNQIAGKLSEEDKEQVFDTPSVFIQYFDKITYTISGGVETATVNIRLYLAYMSLEEEDLSRFPLSRKIRIAMHQFTMAGVSGMMHTGEEDDSNFKNLSTYRIEYKAKVTDTTLMDSVEKVPVMVTPVINADLIIDQRTKNTIRIGKI